jgi:hypothetical protein
VEQKNWTVVRRVAGYGRYETEQEMNILNEIWELEANFTNYVLPQQHLIFKERIGPKVRRKYDEGKTPAQRVSETCEKELNMVEFNMYETRARIWKLQEKLLNIQRKREAQKRIKRMS